jgi:hypothetical protein
MPVYKTKLDPLRESGGRAGISKKKKKKENKRKGRGNGRKEKKRKVFYL